ncbi:MAG TPA: trigger factor [Aggregatilineales bacterium]|nr:trigger factor [Aggregatilineales bacterium]
MKTETEHLENHTARLTVEVEQPRVEKAMQEAARRISRKANVPGFRKGKAPYNVIVQRFGAAYVLEEALDTLGNEIYREALDEAKIEPYDIGSLENIDSENGLKLVFVVSKRPEVDLGTYRDVRVPYEAAEVTDDMVNEAMTRYQDRRAVIEPASRPAQLGDQVKLNVKSTITHPESEVKHDHDEEEKHEESAETPDKPEGDSPAEHEHEHEHGGHTDPYINQDIETILTESEDRDEVLPGFSAQIVGLSAGEEKTFQLAYPADHKDDRIAGHVFDFTVKLEEVRSRTLPALTDDFAKQVTENQIETLLDLRIQTRKELQEVLTRNVESDYADKVLDDVVKVATIKYPEAIVDEYIHQMLDTLDRNLRERGLSLEDYKKLEKKDDAALHDEYRQPAIDRLKRALVMGEVVTKEKLEVSDDDLNTQIDNMSAQFGEQAAVFKKMLLREETQRNIELDLLTERARKRLMQIARGENPPLGADASMAILPVPAEQVEPALVGASSMAQLEGGAPRIILPDSVVNAPSSALPEVKSEEQTEAQGESQPEAHMEAPSESTEGKD